MTPRVVCMCCGATLSPGSEPASHGLGPCCWAAYRAENGLRPRPYPQHQTPQPEAAA
jgi:hypothetical protein